MILKTNMKDLSMDVIGVLNQKRCLQMLILTRKLREDFRIGDNINNIFMVKK